MKTLLSIILIVAFTVTVNAQAPSKNSIIIRKLDSNGKYDLLTPIDSILLDSIVSNRLVAMDSVRYLKRGDIPNYYDANKDISVNIPNANRIGLESVKMPNAFKIDTLRAIPSPKWKFYSRPKK